jgi:ribosome biogenesis protein ENP2
MKVTSVAGVKVYDLSQGKNLPTFLTEKARRNLAKDPEFARRIELLQDFNFPAYSRTVRISRDGRYILASGGYKPHIKMFDVAEVSMKFDRFVDSDIIRAEILSDDFQKLCLMLEDRTLQFHSKFGMHHSVRMPVMGRDVSIDRETCDMYIATSKSSIFRFNLMEGRFRQSWETSQTGENENNEGNNSVVWNRYHRLVAAAGQDGYVRIWDPRQRAEVASLNISQNLEQQHEFVSAAVTAIQYEPSESGLQFIAGTSTGLCSVYDLRSSRSILQKEHPYATPIKSIKFKKHHDDPTPTVVTCDAKQIKGWNFVSGKTLFNIESQAPLQEINVAPVNKLDGDSSGLIFACGDQERIATYFVPSLGPAPVWASFLESLTEELEEKDYQVFDDYKFVTKEELIDVGLSQLLESASDQLRPWMHGYFIGAKTFEKLRAAVAHSKLPSTHEARKQKVEEKKAQRIVLTKKVKINSDLAEKSGSLLKDDRFKELFQDPQFKVDIESAEYKHMFPAGRKKAQGRKNESDEEEGGDESDESEENATQQQISKAAEKTRKPQPMVSSSNVRKGTLIIRGAAEDINKRKNTVLMKSNASTMKSSLLDDVEDSSTFDNEKPASDADKMAKSNTPMMKRLRVENAKDDNVVDIVNTPNTGEMSITFIPKSDLKKPKSGGRRNNPREELGLQ